MNDDGGAFFLGCIVGAAVAVFFTIHILNGDWHVDLINRGYAIYCPDDGGFAYKGECDK